MNKYNILFAIMLTPIYWILTFTFPFALGVFISSASTIALILHTWRYFQYKDARDRQLANTLYRLNRLLK